MCTLHSKRSVLYRCPVRGGPREQADTQHSRTFPTDPSVLGPEVRSPPSSPSPTPIPHPLVPLPPPLTYPLPVPVTTLYYRPSWVPTPRRPSTPPPRPLLPFLSTGVRLPDPPRPTTDPHRDTIPPTGSPTRPSLPSSTPSSPTSPHSSCPPDKPTFLSLPPSSSLLPHLPLFLPLLPVLPTRPSQPAAPSLRPTPWAPPSRALLDRSCGQGSGLGSRPPGSGSGVSGGSSGRPGDTDLECGVLLHHPDVGVGTHRSSQGCPDRCPEGTVRPGPPVGPDLPRSFLLTRTPSREDASRVGHVSRGPPLHGPHKLLEVPPDPPTCTRQLSRRRPSTPVPPLPRPSAAWTSGTVPKTEKGRTLSSVPTKPRVPPCVSPYVSRRKYSRETDDEPSI